MRQKEKGKERRGRTELRGRGERGERGREGGGRGGGKERRGGEVREEGRYGGEGNERETNRSGKLYGVHIKTIEHNHVDLKEEEKEVSE